MSLLAAIMDNGKDGDDDARVPANSRIYAVGDIHGRADLLGRLHRDIVADAIPHAGKRLVLVYLGDYIDRGPQSRKVVDSLLNDPLPGFEIIHLKGNHEDFLVRFVMAGEGADAWQFNGGGATLASYGIGGPTGETMPGSPRDIRAALMDSLPPAHLAFYRDLELSHVEGDYLFVHAGLRPGVSLESQDDHDLMWIRTPFLQADDDFGYTVVHGHSPTLGPEVRANRIGIDTLAYKTGCLTCLVLDGNGRRFLQT